jgi:flavin reductase (DIM6/NTAB) family NADH-FMN oxidoreductase RutF
MSPSSRHFRDTIGLFSTGVAVVVAEAEGEVHAMTVNAVSSLSLDPMLLLFCASKRARIVRNTETLAQFTINILRSDQQPLSSYFAGGWRDSPAPPFRFVPSDAGPRLEGCLAAIGCNTERIADGGDHWLVIGRVITLHRGIEPHRPLIFFKGQYRSLDFTICEPAPDLANVQDEPPHIFYDH